jgi:hypothetical protein
VRETLLMEGQLHSTRMWWCNCNKLLIICGAEAVRAFEGFRYMPCTSLAWMLLNTYVISLLLPLLLTDLSGNARLRVHSHRHPGCHVGDSLRSWMHTSHRDSRLIQSLCMRRSASILTIWGRLHRTWKIHGLCEMLD